MTTNIYKEYTSIQMKSVKNEKKTVMFQNIYVFFSFFKTICMCVCGHMCQCCHVDIRGQCAEVEFLHLSYEFWGWKLCLGSK